MTRRTAAAVALALSAVALAGCTSTDAPTTGSSSSAVSGSITVFAAASLKEAFTTIGDQFEAANPGTSITFSFGPSSGLATQITEKAPADVFASASQKTMDTVVDAGLASGSSVFAVNTLAIATPTDPSRPVGSLADLANPAVKVAVCAADVPCGTAADKLFAQNNLTVAPVTREVDVKAVLSKVQLGEVDAGIVYVTDVKAAGSAVVGIDIPRDQNVTTNYPIAALSGSSNPATARAFAAYVLGPEAQTVLADAGFSAP
ncbi:MAG: molybdate ABC transporter substrate-binding protein [Candidatus Nanopelagicales bacterium]